MALRVVPPIMQFAFALMCFLLLGGCNEKIVDPPIKNPREYTWTIDTLAYPGSFQTNMRDIWASSPTDVYVVGHNFLNRGQMYHYDGKTWREILQIHPDERGNAAIGLAAIFGFGPTDIWVVGQRIYVNPNRPPNYLDSSLVIHYDGRQWREQRIEGGRYLKAVWGNSPVSLWAGGWTKYIYRYDGALWQRDSLPITVQTDGFFQVEAFEGTASGGVFAIGNTHHNSTATTIHYFFQRRENRWIVVDSFFVAPGRIESKWGRVDLWSSPSATLYSCGKGVHRWTGSGWEILFDHPNILSRIAGTSDSNIFVVGHLGTVLHFNGRDWYQYGQFADPNAVLWGIWTDGKETIIVGHTADYPQRTLILRGK